MTRLEVIRGGRIDLTGPSTGASGAPGAGLLEELYRRHAAMVLGRCRYLLGDRDAAQDAAQEVFVAALRSLPEFQGSSSPTAWLLRVATNHCLNVRRAGRAAWPAELATLSRDRRERGIEPDARELVRALLSVSPAEAQEIAVLYFVDELTQVEIAEATGRSLPTIRKRLRQFLGAARAALAEAFPGLTLPDPEVLP